MRLCSSLPYLPLFRAGGFFNVSVRVLERHRGLAYKESSFNSRVDVAGLVLSGALAASFGAYCCVVHSGGGRARAHEHSS